jgi:hypothetical protein
MCNHRNAFGQFAAAHMELRRSSWLQTQCHAQTTSQVLPKPLSASDLLVENRPTGRIPLFCFTGPSAEQFPRFKRLNRTCSTNRNCLAAEPGEVPVGRSLQTFCRPGILVELIVPGTKWSEPHGISSEWWAVWKQFVAARNVWVVITSSAIGLRSD